MEQTNDNIKTFGKEKAPFSTSDRDMPKKFKTEDSGICHSPMNAKIEQTHRVIEYVKNNKGRSLYDIAKELNIPNSTLYYIIKHLEFASVITTRMSLSQNNRAVRKVFYSENNFLAKKNKNGERTAKKSSESISSPICSGGSAEQKGVVGFTSGTTKGESRESENLTASQDQELNEEIGEDESNI